jgi:hypothetical protein
MLVLHITTTTTTVYLQMVHAIVKHEAMSMLCSRTAVLSY